ncbi:MAG: MarR family transcriptional regulator [Thermoplasmata archaeon]|nr:MarR family transcriptional regulator [Thermoplasmata archaeon]
MGSEKDSSTIEYRILEYLRKNYPVKIEDLRKHLKISKQRLERVLKKLEARKIITIDRVSDNTVYVHLVHFSKREYKPGKWESMYR